MREIPSRLVAGFGIEQAHTMESNSDKGDISDKTLEGILCL
jgi:hypothetical protein